MMDLDGDPSIVHGASGTTYQPSKPALPPLLHVTPLYQIVFPFHWHQLSLDSIPSLPRETVFSLLVFSHLHMMRFTFIRSPVAPKCSFHDFD